MTAIEENGKDVSIPGTDVYLPKSMDISAVMNELAGRFDHQRLVVRRDDHNDRVPRPPGAAPVRAAAQRERQRDDRDQHGEDGEVLEHGFVARASCPCSLR